MKAWPLGIRLTAWSALLASIGLILSAAGTCLYVHHELVEDLDDQLRLDAQKFLKSMHAHSAALDWSDATEIDEWLPASNPPLVAVVQDRGGEILYHSPEFSGHLPAPPPGRIRKMKVNGRAFRVGTFADGAITLRLGADLEEVDEFMGMLLTAFCLTLPLVLGFVGIGGRWFAGRALRPLREITDAAELISARRLGKRLPAPRRSDEIGRLAAVLNGTFDRLERSFRQASRFSADASHELKTPLANLRAAIDALLRDPELAEPQAVAVSALLEQTKRLGGIIDGLLLLSRADADHLQLDLRPTDLRELIGECIEDACILAQPRGISITVDLPGPGPVIHPVDPARLTQILLNLLVNAIKYNYTRGAVTVRLESSADRIAIHIANTGPGIPPEQSRQIFDRFYRGSSASYAGSGCGLGLGIASELARAHGGELSLESSDREWTCFRLTLPKAATEHPKTPEAAGVAAGVPVA